MGLLNPYLTFIDHDPSVARLAAEDDGRIHLICIRPAGPFEAFDRRLTSLATRMVRFLRVTILRSWDFAAEHAWVGFVSATLPTVLVVRAGQIIAKSIGDLPATELQELVRGAAH